jgi:hypothetical protein
MVLDDPTRAALLQILNDTTHQVEVSLVAALALHVKNLQSRMLTERPDPADTFRLGYDAALLDIQAWAERGLTLADRSVRIKSWRTPSDLNF